MTVWFIQEDTFDGAANRLAYAAVEQGKEVISAKYVPFDGMEYNLPKAQPVIFYGSLNCVRDFQRRFNNIEPFAWCDFDILRCQNYYAYYGKWLLQQHYGFYPYSEIERNLNWIYAFYGVNNRVFIRPDANNKVYNGEVVSRNQFDRWLLTNKAWQVEPTCLSVVAPPADNILFEFRYVVANGRVIAGSMYKDGHAIDHGEVDEGKWDNSHVALVEEACKVWTPHPVFVMDIAETYDGPKIIEIGSINCAGLYNCNLREVVKHMSENAERDFRDLRS